MFGFGKKKDKKKKEKKDKKKTNVDKLVMGTIVGVAIGSVVGASLFPKKKKETTLSEKKIHRKEPDIRDRKKHRNNFTDADIIENYKKIPNELENTAHKKESADE